MQRIMAGIVRSAALLVVALGLAGCGIESQEAPALIGPSGFGQSVTLNAVPDRLPRDGTSQSVVTITVRNDAGQPMAGQRVTLGANGGGLSQGDVVTGSDGRATFTVTAAPPGSTGNFIEIFATPVGGNFDNAVTRTLTIAVTGPQNSTAPTPQFTVSPQNPGTREPVTFDASATQDEGGPCGGACSYTWNFGEGTIRTGAVVTHTFSTAGTFNVVLTVTDAGGASATRQQVLAVTAVASPTITAIAVAPNPPLAGQQASFTAVATAAARHSITNYAWNFGDGSSASTSTPSVTKTYTSQGVYVVTLTVTQDSGETASVSQQVTIANSAATATISFSPINPFIGQLVSFTALNPSAPNGATITSFEWHFGDPGSGNNTASGQSANHAFASANTYVVRLTVTDSNGVIGVITATVPVVDPAADD
jgi:PKD repeat protein